jgi:hypothetical protein
MEPSLAGLLHQWHDFYVLLGAASATLVGLMFVAVSIGTNLFNEDQSAAMAAFITPTVVHFAAVLFACLIATVPTHTWASLGALIGAGALATSVWSGWLVMQIAVRRRFKVDLSDRLFYALLPLAGYVLAFAAAGMLWAHHPASAELLAAAVLMLLFAAIRNAWDMMVWIVIKTPNR